MALVPSKFVESHLEIPAEWDDGTEQIQNVTLKLGYYTPATDTGDTRSRNRQTEDLLIESDRLVTNRYGTLINREVEYWEYNVYKGPPISYSKETYSNVFLPGLGGREYRPVEEEDIAYWAFTPYTDGDNLGRTRFISAYVVYNLKVTEIAMPDEERQKIIDAGLKPPTYSTVILSSGKLWSDASLDDNIVESESTPQIAKWKKHVIVEHDVVDEQPDRWIIWTIRKNGLRPGHVETIGPREVKKTGFAYRIPYPIGPPKLEAQETATGINVEAFKGGALVTNSWFPIDNFVIKPERYRFYRKKLSEPDRSPEDDPYGWWTTPPTAADQTLIITNTDVTTFAGDASTALPGQSSYTEPHDPAPIDPPEESAFKLIATVDNTKDRHTDEGYGVYLDEDLVSGGEYEYYCTAVIGDDESPHSNHEIVSFNGAHNRRYRITKRELDDGTVETDALAPDDPYAAPGVEDEMGEVVKLEVPTTDDPLEVTEEIADRIFSTAAKEDLNIDVEVLIPMLGLEYGQNIIMPTVVWQALGSDRILTSETIDDNYMLKGFKLKVARDDAGSWSSQKTLLKLRKFDR